MCQDTQAVSDPQCRKDKHKLAFSWTDTKSLWEALGRAVRTGWCYRAWLKAGRIGYLLTTSPFKLQIDSVLYAWGRCSTKILSALGMFLNESLICQYFISHYFSLSKCAVVQVATEKSMTAHFLVFFALPWNLVLLLQGICLQLLEERILSVLLFSHPMSHAEHQLQGTGTLLWGCKYYFFTHIPFSFPSLSYRLIKCVDSPDIKKGTCHQPVLCQWRKWLEPRHLWWLTPAWTIKEGNPRLQLLWNKLSAS